MELWIVGQWRALVDVGLELSHVAWDFQGVFATRAEAVAACIETSYFIVPATLGETWPHGQVEWKGCEYPNKGEADE